MFKKTGYYLRLAWSNMRKSRRFFVPYILALIGMTAVFYMVLAITFDPGLASMKGSDNVQQMMRVGAVIVGIFCVIFLAYTNSFLVKSRRQEFALYRILGMERRNISGVMLMETLLTAAVGILGGIASGIALYKIIQLLLLKTVHFEPVFGLAVSFKAMLMTAAFFAAVLLVLMLFNMIRVGRVKPVELMRSSGAGEREPKTKWPFAVLGVLALGAAYALALSCRDGVSALGIYLPAVILVIVGTYCLFTAVSIAALKLLRKNKRFYYKTDNFIGVSGMLYRMKQNAVGLASICILSTMVMVMVSGTVSLYAGTERNIDMVCPHDVMLEASFDPESSPESLPDDLTELMSAALDENGVERTNELSLVFVNIAGPTEENRLKLDGYNNISSVLSVAQFITAADYARLTGTEEFALADDEVMLYDERGRLKGFELVYTDNDGRDRALPFNADIFLESFPFCGRIMTYDTGHIGVVVADGEALKRVYEFQKEAFGENYSSNMHWQYYADVDDENADEEAQYSSFEAFIKSSAEFAELANVSFDTRAQNSRESYGLTGSFLFLGIFLGLVLMMATVLIIYYKQISEGYEDRKRFEIMRNVGLSGEETRRTISRQILLIFFLPLIVAAVHMVFNFKLMTLMLGLFGLSGVNIKLALIYSILTFLAFAVVYALVFLLTARTYYKIVQSGE